MATQRHFLLVTSFGLSIALHSTILVLVSTGFDAKIPERAIYDNILYATLTTRLDIPSPEKPVTFTSSEAQTSTGQTKNQIPRGKETGGINPTDAYFPPSKLSVLPSPIDSLDPTPEVFATKNLVGNAEIMLLINEKGGVDHVFSIESTLPDPVIDHAKRVFLGARFSPGQIGDKVVKSRIRIGLSVSPQQIPSDTGNPKSAKTRHR